MQRDYAQAHVTMDCDELHWRTAFHEAGHAAAIHIANGQKSLPPVFFEIHIRRPNSQNPYFYAKVIDGNLIQNVPIAVIESYSDFSDNAIALHSCQRAYEADIFNLLVGPLAEAKYISIRDNELINFNLLSLDALNHYGGVSDIASAHDYLESFIACKQQRENKLHELLEQAYAFVDNRANWKAILNLAHYIIESQQQVISCDEIIAVLDACKHR